MKPYDYVAGAMRTMSPITPAIIERFADPRYLQLVHAQMGLCTEIGEFSDPQKRHGFYGALNKKTNKLNLDRTNLIEELGDIMWYIAIACDAIDVSLEEVMERNNAKLKARYPEKFNEVQAHDRDLDAERAILEAQLQNIKKHENQIDLAAVARRQDERQILEGKAGDHPAVREARDKTIKLLLMIKDRPVAVREVVALGLVKQAQQLKVLNAIVQNGMQYEKGSAWEIGEAYLSVKLAEQAEEREQAVNEDIRISPLERTKRKILERKVGYDPNDAVEYGMPPQDVSPEQVKIARAKVIELVGRSPVAINQPYDTRFPGWSVAVDQLVNEQIVMRQLPWLRPGPNWLMREGAL